MNEIFYYFNFVFMGCLLYQGVLGPLLFKGWVIPAIERRYHAKVRARKSYNDILYNYMWDWRWAARYSETAKYIVFKVIKKYFGREPWFVLVPENGTYMGELKRIGYDVAEATNIEIILSFTYYFVYALLLIVLVVLTAIAAH